MKKIAKIIVFVVLGLLVLTFFWPFEQKEVATIRIYVTRDEKLEDYRNFIKEVSEALKDLAKKRDLPLPRIYEVWVKCEKASLTVKGKLQEYRVISLYVESIGPLDWFAVEELINDEKFKIEKAKEFAEEILQTIEDLETLKESGIPEIEAQNKNSVHLTKS